MRFAGKQTIVFIQSSDFFLKNSFCACLCLIWLLREFTYLYYFIGLMYSVSL